MSHHKLWTHVLTPIQFEEHKNPIFSIMIQNATTARKVIRVRINMQLWSPKDGAIHVFDTSKSLRVHPYNSKVIVFEWEREIEEQDMDKLKNRSNLFFYIRGSVSVRWPFASTEDTFCYIYNAWQEPRPKGIPLFVPCGSFTDPQKQMEVV